MCIKPRIDDSLAEISNQVPPEYKSIALPTDQFGRSVTYIYRLHLLFPCMFAMGHQILRLKSTHKTNFTRTGIIHNRCTQYTPTWVY